MKFTSVAALCLVVGAGSVNPIGKVLQLISDLQAKVIKEGEEAQKLYEQYSEWCEDRARQLSFEIKTGEAEANTLRATIASETANSAAFTAKIAELAAGAATDEADLKAATEIRAREQADFAKAESELTETISALQRAVGILEKEAAKGGASMLQLQGAESAVQVFSVLVQAQAISTADAGKLTAFVQSAEEDAEDDGQEPGAPASAVYKSHSGNVIETLQGLLDKAEDQLKEKRSKETADKNNFEMLKQSLDDEIRFATQDMDETKKNLAASGEAKATAEGELQVTSKDLAEDGQAKADLHQSCMTKAEDFEGETRSRGEELKALATAKQLLKETSGGAEAHSYSLVQTPPSFLQARMASSAELAGLEAVRFVRDLARKQSSPALAQLAQRMSAAMSAADASGDDPFAKIKGLISELIGKLEAEADADATEKAYCDQQLSETNEKKAAKTAEIEKLTTKIDELSAQSAQLKEEIGELESALSKLAAAQAAMDKLRSEEKALYDSNRADLELGLDGVKKALKVLNEYYGAGAHAHSAATGAGSGIIGLLEVIESDFSKGLAEVNSVEEAAVAAYERETKDNEIEKTTKDKDVEYKTKEAAFLDKTIAELSSDRAGVQTELDAVLQYLAKIEERCIAKAETYEARKARREAETAGLKEALRILQEETALLQRGALRRRAGLRGGAAGQRHLAA